MAMTSSRRVHAEKLTSLSRDLQALVIATARLRQATSAPTRVACRHALLVLLLREGGELAAFLAWDTHLTLREIDCSTLPALALRAHEDETLAGPVLVTHVCTSLHRLLLYDRAKLDPTMPSVAIVQRVRLVAIGDRWWDADTLQI